VVETRSSSRDTRRARPYRHRAAHRPLEELLAEQKEQAAAGDLRRAVTDRCFHAEIVRSAGNEILSALRPAPRPQLRMGVA